MVYIRYMVKVTFCFHPCHTARNKNGLAVSMDLKIGYPIYADKSALVYLLHSMLLNVNIVINCCINTTIDRFY